VATNAEGRKVVLVLVETSPGAMMVCLRRRRFWLRAARGDKPRAAAVIARGWESPGWGDV